MDLKLKKFGSYENLAMNIWVLINCARALGVFELSSSPNGHLNIFS